MKVLWVGAGASIDGGYPSAMDLLPTIEEEVTAKVVEEGVRDAWTRFASFRNEATGTERTLLSSPNPEVVLTVPDLLDAARSADDDRINRTLLAPAIQALINRRTGERIEGDPAITHDTIEREYEREERRRLDAAPRARDALLRVLDAFFGQRHYDDFTPAGHARRDYLRHELADLEEGDAVITTNWDTMIERTLLEDGRWTPLDGYGFHAPLSPVPPDVRACSSAGRQRISSPRWPEWAPTRSAVRVFKLHGSYGWRTSGTFGPRVEAPGRVYLDHAGLLGAMPLIRPGVGTEARAEDLCLLWDESEPGHFDPSDRYVFAYPSFLKQIAGTTLQDIWHLADGALRGATDMRILGASLPDSDVAVRTLLNPVRFRLRDKHIRVTVDDPSRNTHERWRTLLGDGVLPRTRRAGPSIG